MEIKKKLLMPAVIAASTLPLIACGGSKAPQIGVVQVSSGTNGVELPLSVTARDDNSIFSVSCQVGDEIIPMTKSQGDEYTGKYTPSSFGKKSIICNADDGDLNTNSSEVSFDILPNSDDIEDAIKASCYGEYSLGTSQNGLSMGSCLSSDGTRIGYTIGNINQTQEDFNAAPYTLEGELKNPQHIVPVYVSVDGITVDEPKTTFASEGLTQAQIDELTQNGSLEYNAISATITEDLGTGVVSYSISGSLNMEGKETSIECSTQNGVSLSLNSNTDGKYSLNQTTLEDNFRNIDFDGNLETILSCSQSVVGVSGVDEKSDLRGTISLEKNDILNTAPVYVSGVKNLGCSNGDTIDMPTQVSAVFSDPDGDNVSISYSVGDKFSCVNNGSLFDIVQQNYTISGDDGGGGVTTSPEGKIYVCPNPLRFDGVAGCE